MPFNPYTARIFTASSVQRDAPAASGVYGLSNAQGWLYIGETDNIKARLMEHLQEPSTLPLAGHATGFMFELSPYSERFVLQDRLILELEPAGNRRAKHWRAEGSGAKVSRTRS